MLYYGHTDRGKKRRGNEDFFKTEYKNGVLVAAVCDGMGGANGGSVASALACNSFVSTLFDLLGENREAPADTAILAAVRKANDEVYQLSVDDIRLSGMGTTLVAAIFTDGTLWTVNVGDSRIYRFADGLLSQITTDHSYVQALVDKGEITENEAREHPKKNVILRAVGVEENVRCDVEKHENPSGCYLLCSDGLSGYYNKGIFEDILKSGKPLQEKVGELIKHANACGGEDNITAVLIDCDGKEQENK